MTDEELTAMQSLALKFRQQAEYCRELAKRYTRETDRQRCQGKTIAFEACATSVEAEMDRLTALRHANAG